MIYKTYYNSPLGRIILAANEQALLGVWFDDQQFINVSVVDAAIPEPESALLIQTSQWLDDYFAGKRPPVHALPLAFAGSTFRNQVWAMLQEIPYGETMTYGEIAATLVANQAMQRMSAQAVGNAVGHNPFSILVPCHRVLGIQGNLVGYAGGIDRKRQLLLHEGYAGVPLKEPRKR